jgi:hypothetical protein
MNISHVLRNSFRGLKRAHGHGLEQHELWLASSIFLILPSMLIWPGLIKLNLFLSWPGRGPKGAHLSNSFQELLFNVVFPHIIVKVGGKEHSNKKEKEKKGVQFKNPEEIQAITTSYPPHHKSLK